MQAAVAGDRRYRVFARMVGICGDENLCQIAGFPRRQRCAGHRFEFEMEDGIALAAAIELLAGAQLPAIVARALPVRRIVGADEMAELPAPCIDGVGSTLVSFDGGKQRLRALCQQPPIELATEAAEIGIAAVA